jgi:hypothetical protein
LFPRHQIGGLFALGGNIGKVFRPRNSIGDRGPAQRAGGRIDLKRFLPMFRRPELGRGAHDSHQTRQFIFIET